MTLRNVTTSATCCLLCRGDITAVFNRTIAEATFQWAWPRGSRSSQPCAHASFSVRLFWCKIVSFKHFPNCLFYFFCRGWKLWSSLDRLSLRLKLIFKCAFFFPERFLGDPELADSTSMAWVILVTSFHFQVPIHL